MFAVQHSDRDDDDEFELDLSSDMFELYLRSRLAPHALTDDQKTKLAVAIMHATKKRAVLNTKLKALVKKQREIRARGGTRNLIEEMTKVSGEGGREAVERYIHQTLREHDPVN